MKDNSGEGVSERVQKIIVRQLDIGTGLITADARFREDLDADSLDLVELTMACSLEFGSVMDDDACEIHTVGQLVNYIEQKVG